MARFQTVLTYSDVYQGFCISVSCCTASLNFQSPLLFHLEDFSNPLHLLGPPAYVGRKIASMHGMIINSHPWRTTAINLPPCLSFVKNLEENFHALILKELRLHSEGSKKLYFSYKALRLGSRVRIELKLNSLRSAKKWKTFKS